MERLEDIAESDELYRRLAPEHINRDGTVNSAAFKARGKPDPSFSVDLARLTTAEEALSRAPHEGFRLGALPARVPLSLGLTVRHNPVEGNLAHCVIEGENDKVKCRILARNTRIIK